MPRFNGLAALKMLRESELDLPFILVSGAVGEDVAVEAMRCGADDYVLKSNLARLPLAAERELRDYQVRVERNRARGALSQPRRSRAGGTLQDFSGRRHARVQSAADRDAGISARRQPPDA